MTAESSTAASRSLLRERNARKEAENLLEQKSRELYDINMSLRELNAHLKEGEIRYRSLVELMPDAIWIHSDGKIVFVNPAALNLFGASSMDQMLGTASMDRVPLDFLARVAQGTYQNIAMAQGKPRRAVRLLRLDGELVDVDFFSCAIRFNDEDAVINVAHDISERRRHEMEIEHQATHDLLTGLPNRALFIDRLEHAIRQAERQQGQIAVMFVDLDKFKNINDTLGHNAGDELLRNVASRLSSCVRGSDTVARLGGDEFVLLLDNPLHDNTPSMIAERICSRLCAPVLLAGHEHVVTASIGISVYPEDGTKADTLLKQADIAMYRSKEEGRNGFHFFTREMQNRLDAHAMLEQGMRLALQRKEFIVHYQPQVDLRSGAIVGLEALIRWQSPELGLVSPAEFIPVAEESNLILAIGEWVLDHVCSKLREWQGNGIPIVPVAINVAASQFTRQKLDEVVRQAIEKYRIEPKFLGLELTESLSMSNPNASIEMMHRLKSIGVAMSIDDFGTGYSNLSYLKRFSLDKLKIDKSFILGMTSSPEDCAIVRAVISLAHSLELRAIAEGVETVGQLRILATQQCDEIQGYYFSHPLPESEIVEMLRARRQLDLTLIDRQKTHPTMLLIDDDPHIHALVRLQLHGQPYELIAVASLDEAYELLASHEIGLVVAGQHLIEERGISFFENIKKMYPHTVCILLTGHDDLSTLTEGIKGSEFPHSFANHGPKTNYWPPSKGILSQ